MNNIWQEDASPDVAEEALVTCTCLFLPCVEVVQVWKHIQYILVLQMEK